MLGRRLAAEAVFLDAACALCSAVADDAADRKAVSVSSSPSSPPSSIESTGLSDRQASALEALCFDWAMHSSSYVPLRLSALAGPRARVVSAAARTLAALARCSSHNGVAGGAPVVLGGEVQPPQPQQQPQQPTMTTVRLLSISARFHSELMERLHADPNSAQRAQLLALCEAMSLVRLSFGPRVVFDDEDDDDDETSNQKGDHLHYHHGRPRRRNANDAALSAATVFVARAHPLRVRARQRKSQVSRALAAVLESVLGALCDGGARSSSMIDVPFAAAPSSSSSSSKSQESLPIVASSVILEKAVRSGSVSAGVARAWHEEVATLRADVAAWCSRAAKHSKAGLALVAAATCLEDDARFRDHAPSTAQSLHKALKDKATRAAAVRGIARLARALTVARPGLPPPGESKPCRSTWLAALAAPAVSIILKKGGSSVVVPAGSEMQLAAAAAASEAEASVFASTLLSSSSLAASLPVFPTAISAAKGGALDCERALLDLTMAFAEESPQLALDVVALELLAGADPASAGGVDAAGVGATATLAVLRKSSSESLPLSTDVFRRRRRRLRNGASQHLPPSLPSADPLFELVAARLCPFLDAAGCSQASLTRARRGLGAALAHVELPLAQYRYPLAGCVKPPPVVYGASSSCSSSLSSSAATAGGATSLAAALGDAATSAVSLAAAAFAAAAAAAAAASLSAEECGFACGGNWASVVAFASVSSSSSSIYHTSSSAFASALPPSLAAAIDLAAAQAATPAAIAQAQAAFAPLPLPQVLPPQQHSLLLGGGTVGGGSGGGSSTQHPFINPNNFSPMPRERLLAASLLAKIFACIPAVLPDRWPDADRAVEELPAWTLHADRDGVAAAATAALRRCVACLPRATVARAVRAVAALVLKVPDDCPDVQVGTLALACDLATRWEVALADGTAALEDEELVAMMESAEEDEDEDEEEEIPDGDNSFLPLLPPLSSTEASALDAIDGACLVLLCSGVPRARCAAAAAARASRQLGRALASGRERMAKEREEEERRRKRKRSSTPTSASSVRFSAPPVRLADVIDASGNALAARCCWDWGLWTEGADGVAASSSSSSSSLFSSSVPSSVRWSDLLTASPGGGSDVAITRARWVAEVGRRAAALAPGIGAVASRAVFARVQLALGRDARAAAAGTSILGNGSGGGGGSGNAEAAAAAAAGGGSSGFGMIVMTGGASLPLSGGSSLSSSSTSISVSSSAENLLLLSSTTMNETAAREATRVDALASLACLAAALPPVSVASSGAAGASTASAAPVETVAEPVTVATPPPPSAAPAGTTSSASSSPVSRAATAASSPSSCQGGSAAAATAAATTAVSLPPGSTAGDVIFFSGGSTRRQKQQHRRLGSLVSFSSSLTAAAATSHQQQLTAPSRPSDLRLAAFNLHPHRSLFKALSLSLRSTPEAATRWAAPALAHASLATLELLAEALRPLAVELAADKPRSLRSKGRRDESRAAAAQVWRLLALSAPSEMLTTMAAAAEEEGEEGGEEKEDGRIARGEGGAPALRAGLLSFVTDSLRWLGGGGGGGGGGTSDLGFGVSGPALAGDASTECQAVRLALASVVRRLASVDAMTSARSSSCRSSLILSKPLRRALFDAFDAWRGVSPSFSANSNSSSVSKSSSNGLSGLRGDVARVAAAAKTKYGGGSGDALAGLSAEAVVFRLAEAVEEAALEAQAAMLAGPPMDSEESENEDYSLSLSLTSPSSSVSALLLSKRQPAARALAWADSVLLRCDESPAAAAAAAAAGGTSSRRAGAAVVAGLRNALAAQPHAAPFYVDAAMSSLCLGSSSSSCSSTSDNKLARRGESYATAIADVYSVIDLASSSSSAPASSALPLCSLAAFALFGVGARTAAGRRAASRVLATLESREWGKKRRNNGGGGGSGSSSIAASVAAATLLQGQGDDDGGASTSALGDAGAAAQLRLAEGLASEHPELALPLLQECTSRLLPLAAAGRAPAGVLAALSPLVRSLDLRRKEEEEKKKEEEESGNNDDEASPPPSTISSSCPYPLPTKTCSATISCLLLLTAAMGDQGRKPVDALWVAAATSAAGKERKSSSSSSSASHYHHHRGNASAALDALVSALLGGLPDVPRPPECDAAAGARALAVGAPLEAVAALVGEAALALCCGGRGSGSGGISSSSGGADVLLDDEEAGEDVGGACEAPAAAATAALPQQQQQQQQLLKQQRRLGRPSPVSVSADATTSFAASAAAAAAGNAPTPPAETAGTRRPPLHPSSRASPVVPSRRAKAGTGGSNVAPSSAAAVAAPASVAPSPLLASDPRARAGAALWLLAHAVGHVAVDAKNEEDDESDSAAAAAAATAATMTRAALAARAPVVAHASLLALATGWPGAAARGARAALAALVVASSSAAEAEKRRYDDNEEPKDEPASAAAALADSVDAAAARLQRASEAASRLPSLPRRSHRVSSSTSSSASFYHLRARRAAAAAALRAAISEVVAAAAAALPALAQLSSVMTTTTPADAWAAIALRCALARPVFSSSIEEEGEEDPRARGEAVASHAALRALAPAGAAVVAPALAAEIAAAAAEAARECERDGEASSSSSSSLLAVRFATRRVARAAGSLAALAAACPSARPRALAMGLASIILVASSSAASSSFSSAEEISQSPSARLFSSTLSGWGMRLVTGALEQLDLASGTARRAVAAAVGGCGDDESASSGGSPSSCSSSWPLGSSLWRAGARKLSPAPKAAQELLCAPLARGDGGAGSEVSTTTIVTAAAAATAAGRALARVRASPGPATSSKTQRQQQLRRSRGNNGSERGGWVSSWSAPRRLASSSSSSAAASLSTPLGSPEDQLAAALFAGLPWAIARARCSSSSSASNSAASAAAVSFLQAHADAAEGIRGLEKLGASLRRLVEAPSSEAAASAALREAVEGLIRNSNSSGGSSSAGSSKLLSRSRRSEALRLCGVTLSSPTATTEHRKASLRFLTALLRFEGAAAVSSLAEGRGRGLVDSSDNGDSGEEQEDATVALSAAVASLGGSLGDEGLAALRAALAVSVKRVSHSREVGRGEEDEENALPLEQQQQRRKPPPSTPAERAALAVDALARVACAWPTATACHVLASR